jgi:hypothetical protein
VCKKEREAFYTLRPTPTPSLQPWPLNGGCQFKDYNPTISLQHFVLGFVLIFFYVSSCFVQDVIIQIQNVITQIQDVMIPSPRCHDPKCKMSRSQVQDVMISSPKRHGPSQRALTNPLNGHIFYKRRNLPNPRVPVGS